MAELVDTLWLTLRKAPVIFLHWYHHVTVLLYCWHSYSSQIGTGLWFAAMNYSVHSVSESHRPMTLAASPVPTPTPAARAGHVPGWV